MEVIIFSKNYPLKLLNKIINDIKYKEWLLKNTIKSKDIKISINNINILENWIITALQDNINQFPNGLLDIVTQLVCYDVDYNDSQNCQNIQDKVQLMTIHSSKGLEFSSVFIVGVEEGILPHKTDLDNNIHEERRLMYVGITRAKKKLTFSYCQKRYQYGQVLYVQPSRFLFELPNKDVTWKKSFNNI